jgi:hypothetical protein
LNKNLKEDEIERGFAKTPSAQFSKRLDETRRVHEDLF